MQSKELPDSVMHKDLSHFTVSTHFVRLLTDYMASCNLAIETLCIQHNIDPTALDNSDGRIAFTDYAKLLDNLAVLLDEPHIGLRLGERARLAHLGTAGLAQMACSDVKELLPRMARYNSLIMDAFEDDLDVVDGELILRWLSRIPEDTHISRHHAELNFALTQSLIPQYIGEQIFPRRVCFRHPPPADPEILKAFFKCEVSFNAPIDLMTCGAEILDRKLGAPDPLTLQMLDRICEHQLKALEDLQEPEWLRACKQAITKSLQDGQPEFSQVAQTAGYEARQLRRKLSEQNLNFRSLLDKCRQDLAQAYIADTSLSLVEVAMLLGFSEQSAFQRAYRRWTGEAPGGARRRLTV
jgi:AraC-like DNA-binding protein